MAADSNQTPTAPPIGTATDTSQQDWLELDQQNSGGETLKAKKWTAERRVVDNNQHIGNIHTGTEKAVELDKSDALGGGLLQDQAGQENKTIEELDSAKLTTATSTVAGPSTEFPTQKENQDNRQTTEISGRNNEQESVARQSGSDPLVFEERFEDDSVKRPSEDSQSQSPATQQTTASKEATEITREPTSVMENAAEIAPALEVSTTVIPTPAPEVSTTVTPTPAPEVSTTVTPAPAPEVSTAVIASPPPIEEEEDPEEIIIESSASAPILNASDSHGVEDNAVAIEISAGLTDTDGSETLAITIEGVPIDATLSAGVDLGNGTWELTNSELTNLTLLPPTNNDQDFSLTITVTSTEHHGGATSSVSEVIDVFMEAVNDAPIIANSNNINITEDSMEGFSGYGETWEGDIYSVITQEEMLDHLAITDVDSNSFTVSLANVDDNAWHGGIQASDSTFSSETLLSGSANGDETVIQITQEFLDNYPSVDAQVGDFYIDHVDFDKLNEGEIADISFSVQVSDGEALSQPQNFNIHVTGSNDAPTISGTVILPEGTEDTPQSFSTAELLANATDIDSDANLSVANVTVDPAQGALTHHPDGTFTFTPKENYNGEVAISYDVTDGIETIAAAAELTLSSINDGPDAMNDVIGNVTSNAMSFDRSAQINTTSIVDTAETGDQVTVSFDMTWDGTNSVMPVGFDCYDLWITGNNFGFNTGNGDLYGVSTASDLVDGNHTITAVFTQGDTQANELYIDGVKQDLSQLQSTPNDSRADITDSLNLSGWDINSGYKFSGNLDNVQLHDRALTDEEAQNISEGSVVEDGLVAHYDFEGPDPLIDKSNNENDAEIGAGNPQVVENVTFLTEDTTIEIPSATLLANDTDIDGDTLSISAVSKDVLDNNNNVVGTAIQDDNGNIIFTPGDALDSLAKGDSRDVSFTYSIDDGHNGTDMATATIQIQGTDDKPVLVEDSAVITEYGSSHPETPNTVHGNLLTNDSDVDDGSSLSVTGVGFSHTMSFDRSAQVNTTNIVDTAETGDQVTVSFDMNWDGTNSVMPVGFDCYDLWITGNNIGFNTGNGDLYGVNSASELANGSHTITAVFTQGDVQENELYIDGVKQDLSQLQSTPNTSKADITDELNLSGWDVNSGYKFSGQLDNVQLHDRALTEDEAVDISEGDVIESGLVAHYDFEGSEPLADKSGNENDAEVGAGNPQAELIEGSNVEGTTVINGTFGILTIDQDGSYSYELDDTNSNVNALAEGETLTESFSIDVTETDTNLTLSEELNFTINGADDVPVLLDDNVNISEDSSETLTGNVLSNDTDVDNGSNFSVTGLSGVTVLQENFDDGNADGWVEISYNDTDTGHWQVADGAIGEGSNSAKGIIAHDMGENADTTNYEVSVDIHANAGNTYNNNVGVTFAYEDNDNFYMVKWDDYSDSYSESSTHKDFQLIRVEGGRQTIIDQVDHAELPSDFTLSVNVSDDNGISITVDGEEKLTAEGEHPPINTIGLNTDDNDGGVSYDNVAVVNNDVPIKDVTSIDGLYGTLTLNSDGSYSYDLDDTNSNVQVLHDGEQLIESFTVNVLENQSGETGNEALNITINGTNDAPVAVDDSTIFELKTVFEDTFTDGNTEDWTEISYNDRDIGNWQVVDGAIGERSNSAKGIMAHDMGDDTESTNYEVAVDVHANSGQTGNNNVGITFGYEDNDNYYMVKWDDYSENYSEGSSHKDFKLVKVEDGRQTIIDQVEHAELSSDFNLSVNVSDDKGISIQVDGTEMLTAAEEHPAINTIGLNTDDNDGGISYDNVSVKIASDQTITTDEDTPLVLSAENLLANDTDVEGDSLSITAVSKDVLDNEGNIVGSTTLDDEGNILFTPGSTLNSLAEGENKNVNFTYTVSDEQGDTDTANVSVMVSGSNDAPVVKSIDLGAINEDQPVKFSAKSLLAEATDVDGDSLHILEVHVDEEYGTMEYGQDADGNIESFAFVPSENFNGEDVPINFTVSDGQSKTEGKAVIDVTAVNDEPVIEGSVDLGAIQEDTEIKFEASDLLKNASDVDGDKLSITAVSKEVVDSDGKVVGTAKQDDDGNIVFTPDDVLDSLNDGESKDINLSYTVADGQGGADTATATITVQGTDNDLTYVSETAGYKNVVGIYQTDEEGNPVSGIVVIDDQNGMTEGIHLTDLEPGNNEFFIIANGADEIDDDSAISFDTSGDHPVLLIDGEPASHPVYYTEPGFNPDGKDHFQFESDGEGGTYINIEDLPDLGDADFGDVVLHTNFEMDDKTAVGALSDSDQTTNSIDENATAGTDTGITATAVDMDGDTVSYSLSGDANGRFSIDSETGKVTVARDDAFDFDAANSHNITVEATSSDGTSSTESFTVDVADVQENLVPTSVSETQSLFIGGPPSVTSNVTFVVDVSSSMSDTDLSVTEDAISSIIAQYDEQGDVHVNIIQFWGNNNESTGWQEGNDQISLYTDKSGTDPEQGLQAAVAAYDGTEPQADNNAVYVFADGNSYGAYEDDFDAFMPTWNSFVDEHIDDLQTIGVNSGSLSDLDTIAEAGDNKPIYVNDVGDLEGIVSNIATVPDISSVTGNVLDNVSGGDGDISITAITVGDIERTADDMPVTTPEGASLDINFDTGEYIYSGSADNFSTDTTESFSVTATDTDGDTTNFDVNINIDVTEQEPPTPEPVQDENLHYRNVEDGSEQDGDYTQETLTTGAGNDTILVDDDVDDQRIINTNDGDDTLTISDDLQGNSSINTSAGNDSVTVAGDIDKATLNTGDGDDSVNVHNMLHGTVDTGTGNDTVTIDRLEDDSIITTGDGIDNVKLDNVSSGFDEGSVSLGADDDSLTINDSLSGTDAIFDGGDGSDNLILNGVDKAGWDAGVRDNFTNFENITLSDSSFTIPNTQESKDGDDADSAIHSSQLIDGAVEGIEYTTSSGLHGFTDETGGFDYKNGDEITFNVGGVTLGTATSEDVESGKTFLQDIADVDRTDLNDEYLENMATFLQSIDDNSDAYDGIVVTDEIREALAGADIDLRTATEDDVQQLVEQVGKSYVEEDAAMEHVEDMLVEHTDLNHDEFEEHIDDDASDLEQALSTEQKKESKSTVISSTVVTAAAADATVQTFNDENSNDLSLNIPSLTLPGEEVEREDVDPAPEATQAPRQETVVQSQDETLDTVNDDNLQQTDILAEDDLSHSLPSASISNLFEEPVTTTDDSNKQNETSNDSDKGEESTLEQATVAAVPESGNTVTKDQQKETAETVEVVTEVAAETVVTKEPIADTVIPKEPIADDGITDDYATLSTDALSISLDDEAGDETPAEEQQSDESLDRFAADGNSEQAESDDLDKFSANDDSANAEEMPSVDELDSAETENTDQVEGVGLSADDGIQEELPPESEQVEIPIA